MKVTANPNGPIAWRVRPSFPGIAGIENQTCPLSATFVEGFVYAPGMGAEREVHAAPMQSPVNWAMLGLVIERPSYAYELAKRFERTYESVLSLSSISHAYTALAALRERSLIIELAGTREGRQPKPRYEATPQGLQEYEDWLVSQVGEDTRRQRLLVLMLARFTRAPAVALRILDRYEQACLTEARETPITDRGAQVADGPAELAARLTSEERRLALGAKLQWVQYARKELSGLAQWTGAG